MQILNCDRFVEMIGVVVNQLGGEDVRLLSNLSNINMYN